MWSPGFDNRVGEKGKDGEDASSLLRDPFPVETLDSGGESIGKKDESLIRDDEKGGCMTLNMGRGLRKF